jgi:hypothetical protein
MSTVGHLCAYSPTPLCIHMNRYGTLSASNWSTGADHLNAQSIILGVKPPTVDVCRRFFTGITCTT